MFSAAQLIILIAAVGGSGLMAGAAGFLLGRLRSLDRPHAPETLALLEPLLQVQEELDRVQHALARLEEQADFTGRLLAGRDRQSGTPPPEPGAGRQDPTAGRRAGSDTAPSA